MEYYILLISLAILCNTRTMYIYVHIPEHHWIALNVLFRIKVSNSRLHNFSVRNRFPVSLKLPLFTELDYQLVLASFPIKFICAFSYFLFEIKLKMHFKNWANVITIPFVIALNYTTFDKHETDAEPWHCNVCIIVHHTEHCNHCSKSTWIFLQYTFVVYARHTY